MATAPNDDTAVTTGTAVRVPKFDLVHYRHKDLLLVVNQISESGILLRDRSGSHVLFFAQSILSGYSSEYARETLSINSAATANHSNTFKGSPSATLRVLDEAASLALLEVMHRHQAVRDLQRAGYIAQVKALLLVQCVMRVDGHTIAKIDALKLSNLPKTLTSLLIRLPFFVLIAKFVMNFSAAFVREHNFFFCLVRMMDMIEDMVPSDFVTCNNSQRDLRYIWDTKLHHQRPNTLNIIEDINGWKTRGITLGISHLYHGTLFSS